MQWLTLRVAAPRGHRSERAGSEMDRTRTCLSGVVTSSGTGAANDPSIRSGSPRARHVGLAITALALGGFAIGTTEFVTMGLLPEIADGIDASIPRTGHVITAYAFGVVVGAP